jgi:hypothetical protein
LRKRGLNSAATKRRDPDSIFVFRLQLRSGCLQVKLNDLWRTGPHEKQTIYSWATGNEFAHNPIQLLMTVRHTREVALT